ncbi:MAG: DUF3037 domain-containing protein [Alphaproteobacteria bacterium]|nr:DUF3037 domain-containing protein [Alphaproteobacteria bacterium]
MTDKAAFSYVLLRYLHDVLTGEFVNVGVVLFVPSTGQIKYRMRDTIGRLKGAFPDIDRRRFLSDMTAMCRGLQMVERGETDAGPLPEDADVMAVAYRALPPDDSALQWSPPGSGLTGDPEATLDDIFERFVSRYDTDQPHRSDDDVWCPVQQRLEIHNLTQHFAERSFAGGLDDIVFQHALKLDQWHIYQPLSFDLSDAEAIKAKAREWLGHLSAVAVGGKAEPFGLHFIVAAPKNPILKQAYHKALAILAKAPNVSEIFEDSELEKLIARIADDVRVHSARSGMTAPDIATDCPASRLPLRQMTAAQR